MAWEWVAPVATAGAGAVGVFFTWLTGKQARDHDQERTRADHEHSKTQQVRSEKREAYLEFLASIARMEEALLERTFAQTRSDDRRGWARNTLVGCMLDTREKGATLRLVAPDEVIQESKKITDSVARKLKQIREGEGNVSDARLSTSKCLKAMAKDLGYWSVAEDHAEL